MRKFILYIAGSLDEVYECAYSILKYLEVYNLKPPADHSLIIYTNYPDLLEVYGSFFHGFELKTLPLETNRKIILSEFIKTADGEVIHLDSNSYPVNKIDGSLSVASGGSMAHYHLKEFRTLLRDFFGRYQEESVANQVKLIHNIDATEIEKEKKKFDSLPLTSKWFKKIIGKGWNISNYLVRI